MSAPKEVTVSDNVFGTIVWTMPHELMNTLDKLPEPSQTRVIESIKDVIRTRATSIYTQNIKAITGT